MDQQDQTPPDEDHLSTYLQSVDNLNERFGRIAREHRRVTEEWQRVAAALRSLSRRDED
jgi:hypothetical protein